MNERIKLLAEQAEFSEKDLHIQADNFQKFAELIVSECADICYKLAEDSNSYVVHDGDTCGTQIKKHFGVEE